MRLLIGGSFYALAYAAPTERVSLEDLPTDHSLRVARKGYTSTGRANPDSRYDRIAGATT